ncbi:hypothetical protein LMH87_002944 [Akanthomyces muscarius]|uniref:Uncharacterized protein n=1 Tax=Akanthomyces muscarius TaxID=2231603 RepID=A0A9W8UK58_AKAMU|nr:hypothetical protein LMH87_002944 [Akanthomyces muscarius]KAJ4148478.1 hypothetical protein LMH87_002944 [Akanthomyces muscarius]
MRSSLLDWLRKPSFWWPGRRRPADCHTASASSAGPPHTPDDGDYSPSPADYPVFPPPPPRSILENQTQYWEGITARKFGAPEGVFEDSSLFALYRLYEFLVLDHVIDYRNCLEAFWRQRNWAVQDIPDPKDGDAERYAFLAGCTFLLLRSFNERVALGLRRDNPSLITPEEAEAARNVPDHLRPWEKVPEWAAAVTPLEDTLVIPTLNGTLLTGKSDSKADPDFLEKNILLWKPHISFT